MRSQDKLIWQLIQSATYKKVISVQIVICVTEGTISDENIGSLLLVLEDGSILFLESASDGVTLETRSEPWTDPFIGELDDGTKDWIRTYGKEELIDYSGLLPYSELIEAQVQAVYPFFDEMGILSGVQFLIGDTSLNYVLWLDLGHILWGKNNPLLAEKGFTLGQVNSPESER